LKGITPSKKQNLPILTEQDIKSLSLYAYAALLINTSSAIVYANSDACDLFGYSQLDFQSLKLEELMPKHFRKKHGLLMQSFLDAPYHKRMSWKKNIKIETKDGLKRDAMIDLNPVIYKETLHVLCSIIDVTERMQYEKGLNSKVDIAKLDVVAARFFFKSALSFEDSVSNSLKTICEVLGYFVGHLYYPNESETLLLPTDIWYFENEEKIKSFKDVSMRTNFKMDEGLPGRVWKSKMPAWIEDVRKDENFLRLEACEALNIYTAIAFPVIVNNKVIAVLELFHRSAKSTDDELLRHFMVISEQLCRIYEKKAAQERIKMLVSLPENNPNPVFRMRKDGRILYTNQSGKMFLEKASKVPNKLPDSLWRLLKDVFIVSESSRFEYKLDNAIYLLNISMLEGGEIANLYISEITDKIVALKEKNLAQEQLFQSQKLESIGQLAGGVAHDFNNILAAILGEAALLKNETKRGVDEKAKDRINVIELSATRAVELTQKLLGFARKGQYEKKPINLNDLVAECCSIVSNTIDKKIKIISQLDADLKFIEGDSSQFMQVLMNLSLNARDAIKSTGEIKIQTKNINADELIQRGYEAAYGDAYVKLIVTDSGCGILPEHLENIYEPFFSTKAMGEGTGLGLSLVYGIVKNHLGVIDVQSTVDQGTTFTLYFPAVSDADSKKMPEKAKAEEDNIESLAGLRVLVVDDEMFLVEIAEERLLSEGAKVVGLTSSLEAHALLKQPDTAFDVLLLDIMMPELDGYVLLDLARQKNPNQKAILTSGYTKEDILKTFANDKHVVFLGKPYTKEALLTALTHLMNA
jgi:PAS domain S-box-containing protein